MQSRRPTGLVTVDLLLLVDRPDAVAPVDAKWVAGLVVAQLVQLRLPLLADVAMAVALVVLAKVISFRNSQLFFVQGHEEGDE